jgi:CO/xanthine dehydrogenase FAD-binding subunit
MSELRYEAPEALDAAVALLAGADGEARVLAGGTDIMVQFHYDMIQPDLIVDIKKIPETQAIEKIDGAWRVGAAAKGMNLVEHEAFNKDWPGVIDGVKLIGSIQVKGRASMGGNLCNASPAADSVPPLIAAGVICNIAGPGGERQAPVEDIVTGPGQTSLKKGEFVVSFSFPAKAARSGDAYQRFIPRTEMDIAVVGVSVCLTLDKDDTIAAARVVLGAVAPTQLLVQECADAIIGTKLDDEAVATLSAAASAACNPIDDKRGTKEFRIKVAGVLAERVARDAYERARQS